MTKTKSAKKPSLDELFALEEKKETAKLAKRDAAQKAKGMKFRATAWVHPKRGGDDYQVDIYFQQATKADVVKWLTPRSSVTNDFVLVKL